MSNTKALYGEQQLPVAVATRVEDEAAAAGQPVTPSMLHASMFAQRLAGEYMFGVSDGACVQSLRRLADAIEAGTILPQNVKIETFADVDDFTRTVLTFECVEKPIKGASTCPSQQ